MVSRLHEEKLQIYGMNIIKDIREAVGSIGRDSSLISVFQFLMYLCYQDLKGYS